MIDLLLAFDDESHLAEPLAGALGVPLQGIDRHRFPDGESRLRLPPRLPPHVALLRGLQRPNQKLVELMIAAQAARELGVQHLTLVCPYLAYMRQDMAFQPGEAVSQRHVGRALAAWFDTVITVDPHLHRVATLSDAVPAKRAVALSAAALFGDHLAPRAPGALLVGPDEESAQWLAAAAAGHRFETAVCRKVRRGDRDVDVDVPPARIAGRAVVLVDDMASTGTTLAVAARRCLALGAATVDALVVHGLFVGDAVGDLRRAGVRHVWSTDSVLHATNVLPLAGLLAGALADDAPVGAAASP